MSVPKQGPAFTFLAVSIVLLSSHAIGQESSTWIQLGDRLNASPSSFAEVDVSRHAVNPSLASGTDSAYLTWVEMSKFGVPQIHVQYWNHNTWRPLGGSLNLDRDHNAFDPAIAVERSEPYVAWIEVNKNGTPQLHVKHWTPEGWTVVGEALNEDAFHPAANPTINVTAGKVYLAWAERDEKNIYQINVKVLTKNGWERLGGILNEDPEKDAISPSITLVGPTPFIAWCEKDAQDQFQVFVKHWTGKEWVPNGKSLNIDTSSHAVSPSIASNGSAPYITFVEFNQQGIAQVHIKHWLEENWISLSGSINVNPEHHALSPTMAFKDVIPFVAWAESNSEGIPRIYIKHWTGSDWVLDEPSLNVEASNPASAPTLTVVQGRLHAAWKEADETGIYSIVVKVRKQ
jgi:hypothetical protein